MGKSMKNENEAIIRDEELRWLLNAIQEVAKTGIRPDGLYWRASYTPEDAAAVALLKSYMEQAGMRVFFDAVGNLHGVLQGKSEQVIMAGSHRDTVRSGGKYDGMLGILSACRGSMAGSSRSSRSTAAVMKCRKAAGIRARIS